jgi:hypothetical protein
MLSISDKFGKIRTEFTDEELAQLNEEQMATLPAVVHAARETESAEEADRRGEAKVAECAKALADAEQAYQATLPKWTALDEQRRMAEQQRRMAFGQPPLPPVALDGDPTLAAAVKKADDALQVARQVGYEMKNILRSKRGLLSEALQAWQKTHATTPEQHYREHLARQQEFYRKIAEGEIETREEVEHTPSHLDRSLGSGRNLGANSINHGYGRRHGRRGTYVQQPKLPSQR